MWNDAKFHTKTITTNNSSAKVERKRRRVEGNLLELGKYLKANVMTGERQGAFIPKYTSVWQNYNAMRDQKKCHGICCYKKCGMPRERKVHFQFNSQWLVELLFSQKDRATVGKKQWQQSTQQINLEHQGTDCWIGKLCKRVTLKYGVQKLLNGVTTCGQNGVFHC